MDMIATSRLALVLTGSVCAAVVTLAGCSSGTPAAPAVNPVLAAPSATAAAPSVSAAATAPSAAATAPSAAASAATAVAPTAGTGMDYLLASTAQHSPLTLAPGATTSFTFRLALAPLADQSPTERAGQTSVDVTLVRVRSRTLLGPSPTASLPVTVTMPAS
jgi:hypothetical protein